MEKDDFTELGIKFAGKRLLGKLVEEVCMFHMIAVECIYLILKAIHPNTVCASMYV